VQQKPSDELIKGTVINPSEAKHMKDILGNLGNCLMHTECVNLDAFEPIGDELETMTETAGHELFKLQNSLAEVSKNVEENTKPIVHHLEERRNDIHELAKSLETQLGTISTFRDNIMKAEEQPNSDSAEYRRLAQNIANAHRILTQIQQQQKSLTQSFDIQIAAQKPYSLNIWIILCCVFGFIQLVLVLLKFCTKGNEAHLI